MGNIGTELVETRKMWQRRAGGQSVSQS